MQIICIIVFPGDVGLEQNAMIAKHFQSTYRDFLQHLYERASPGIFLPKFFQFENLTLYSFRNRFSHDEETACEIVHRQTKIVYLFQVKNIYKIYI